MEEVYFYITVTDPDEDILQRLEVDFGDGSTQVVLSRWYSGDVVEIPHDSS